MTAAPTTTRYEFLDWLRVIAIFVLLFFHTGMLFVDWGWHITNAETLPVLELPMDLAHRLRMPLLFVIAGAGMWFAVQRRSGPSFTRERTLRLLVPVIAGMILIVPPQVYVERLTDGDWSGGYFAFLTQRVFQFQPYPAGDFSWHHLWFIVYLYAYALLLLPLLLWWRRARPRLTAGAWLFALALPLGINEALLKPHFPESHNLVSDWYVFVHYLLLTLYGVLLAACEGAWDYLERVRHRALALALTITLGVLTLIELGVIARDTVTDSVFANIFTWTWLMAFLGYGRRHLSFGNRVLSWARDAGYPIYILHQTVIIVIAYFVIQMAWTPWTKYWVVLLSTLLVSAALYEYVLRRSAVLRILFGIKAPGPTRAAGQVVDAVLRRTTGNSA